MATKKKPAAAKAAPQETPKPALTGSIANVQAAIQKAVAPSTIITVSLVAMSALLAMPEADLVESMKQQCQTAASQHIGMGKMLFALEKKRGTTTLSKFVKKHGLGEIDSSAYKTCNAYRMVGEGHGNIHEEHFDKAKLRWLITTSQILNCLDKYADGPEKQEIREQVAKQLRTPTDQTPAVLQSIYEQVKPDSGAGDGEGEGEGEGADAGTKPSALQLVAMLIEEIKAGGARAVDCEDAAALQAAFAGVETLQAELGRATTAAGMLREIIAEKLTPANETPAEEPAAVAVAA